MSKTWSDQQQAIFNWFSTGTGSLIVRARAGTGKTTTILQAISHAPETKILLCAFNKRIAVELTEKLSDPRAEAKTLHSLGFAFIRREWKNVKLDNNIEFERASRAAGVQAPDEMIGLVKQLVGKAKNCEPFATIEQLGDLAEEWDLTPDNSWSESGWDKARVVAATKKALEMSKVREEDGRISFDDMLYIPVACNMIRPWYQMVVVDEAQDMNACQLIIAQKACKRSGRVVVVGDDRQAIYGFRGADSGSIDRLKAALNAVELGLNTTYRCGKSIVAEAQRLVPDYTAAPTAPHGVVDTLRFDHLLATARAEDFILSRKNAPLMVICLRFLRAGVACRIEGRDVGAGLANLVKKFKARSVPDFIKRLGTWKVKETKRINSRSKDKEAALQIVDDQVETLTALADGAANVQEITDRCFRLFEDSIDQQTGKKNLKPAIVCSSVHKAKGLEADRVFLLEDTFLRDTEREEANIKYVAITRAKAHLTWVVESPWKRKPRGQAVSDGA